MDDHVVTDGSLPGDGDASTLPNDPSEHLDKNNLVDSSSEGHSGMVKSLEESELFKKTGVDLDKSHFDRILNGDTKNKHGTCTSESKGVITCDDSNDIEFGDTNSIQTQNPETVEPDTLLDGSEDKSFDQSCSENDHNVVKCEVGSRVELDKETDALVQQTDQVSDELDAGVLTEEVTDIRECKNKSTEDSSENFDFSVKVAATERCEIIGDKMDDAELPAGDSSKTLDKSITVSTTTKEDSVAMDTEDVDLNNKVDLARNDRHAVDLDGSGGHVREISKVDDMNSKNENPGRNIFFDLRQREGNKRVKRGHQLGTVSETAVINLDSSEAPDVKDKVVAEDQMLVDMATLLPVPMNENSLVTEEKGLASEDSDHIMTECVSKSNKLSEFELENENPNNETSQNKSELHVAMDTENCDDNPLAVDANLVAGDEESDFVAMEVCEAETMDKEKGVAGSPVPENDENVKKAAVGVKMNVDDDLGRYLLREGVGDKGSAVENSVVENINSAKKTDFKTDTKVVASSGFDGGLITAECTLDEESEIVDVVSDLVESLHDTFAAPRAAVADEVMNAKCSQGTAIYESDNSFKCQQCGTSYDTSEEFQEHVVGHLVQNSLTSDTMDDDAWSTCPICLVMFPEFSMYEEHLKNHLNNVYKCTVCNKTFSERKDLEDHVNKVHNVDRPFKCSECGKMFKSISMLGTHLRKVHGKELSNRCDFCTLSFLTREDVDLHMRLKHAKKLKTSGKKRKRQFTCDVCSRIYFDRKLFEVHKRQGHRPVSVGMPNPDMSDSSVTDPIISLLLTPKTASVARKLKNIPLGGHRELSNNLSPVVSKAETLFTVLRQANKEELTQTADEHLKQPDQPGLKQPDKQGLKQPDKQGLKPTPSEDGSDTADNGTPSKRRRSRRVAYLESLVHGCELCDSRFATENDYRSHLKERHNSILNDYGEVVRLTQLENQIKRRRKSSQSGGTNSRKPRVQELRDESESSNSPRDSPVIFDKEDPLYEPAASSDDDEDESPKPTEQLANDVVDEKTFYRQVVHQAAKMPATSSVDTEIPKLPKGQNMRAWNCTICYLTFFKLLDLKQHVLSKHLRPIVGLSGGYFLCPYCSKSLQSKVLVEKHISYYHSLKELLEKYSKPNAVVPALSLMSCKICGQQFLGSLRLNEHMKKSHKGRHEPRRYNCHICNKSFGQMDILLAHIRSDHDQKKESPIQPASTSSIHQLPSKPNPSVQSTSGTTEAAKKFYFACAVCEEGFNREADLEDHIVSIHRLAIAPNRREKKPYGCLLCEKRFTQLNSITLHLVSYHKQDEHDIMGGRRKETEDEGRRTHQCLICLEYFSKKKFLDKHARRNNCRPSSQPKRPLPKRRVVVHDEGERPLDCPKCSGKYWGKAYLYLHVLEVHGNATLGEFLLKKKIEDAAKEDFNDDTEEQDGPFPVAIYAAGSPPKPGSPRRPLRGGFLPAGSISTPNLVPASSLSAPVKIVPKENPSEPDVIDLTDDDPVVKEPIPKLCIIKRTPGNEAAPGGIGQPVRNHHQPNDRQQHPRRPVVPMNHNVQPGTVRQGVQLSRYVQQGGHPGVQTNRQVHPGAVRLLPPSSQLVRQKLNQQLVRRTSQPVGIHQNHASNQAATQRRPNILKPGTSPGSSAGQPRPGPVPLSSQARPVSSTASGPPKSFGLYGGTLCLPPKERISGQTRQTPQALQRPNQPPIKKTTSGPKSSTVVDLTEDSDEEIVDITPLSPPKSLQDKNIKCIHCSEIFSEPLQMLIHVYSDHVKHNPYVCAFCEETITDREALQDHIKTHEQFKMIKSIIGIKEGLKLPSVIDEEIGPEVIDL